MCCASRVNGGNEFLIDLQALVDEFDDLSQCVGVSAECRSPASTLSAHFSRFAARSARVVLIAATILSGTSTVPASHESLQPS